MTFASPQFLLFLLPLVLIVFYSIRGANAAHLRLGWLLIASTIFYVYSGVADAAVLALSLIANFAAARLLADAAFVNPRHRRALLATVVIGNVALLMSFKFFSLYGHGAGASGAYLSGSGILIPLGLSFITFQQIAFVVDCYHRRIVSFTVRDYVFFITFFPQLVMGPIVQFRQLVPQLHAGALSRLSSDNLAVGLAIFAFGLFKKVVVADSIAPGVDHVFNAAASSASALDMLDAWGGAIGFQLQLFMDFSAYADMAIGLARMFNIDLPINFDEPYRAINRFDLWKRWHITFVEFMRLHVFRPLARLRWMPMPMALAITGMLSGLWHGLGWTFVAWGMVQTLLLLASHYWTRWRKSSLGSRLPQWLVLRILLTFAISAMVGVLFRAPSLDAARNIYAGLFAFHDLGFPERMAMLLSGMGIPVGHAHGTPASMIALQPGDLPPMIAGALLTWVIPPASTLFANYWTAIDPRPAGVPTYTAGQLPVRVRLSLRWGLVTAALLVFSLLALERARRFVYVQF